MSIEPTTTRQPYRLGRYVAVLTVWWTLFITAALIWNLSEINRATFKSALIQARAEFDKDLLINEWAASHKVIYVPITKETPPNPDLDHHGERDIETPSGLRLTQINPAYLSRQINELALKELGIRAHRTSLKPLRAANAADPWETKALMRFEQGDKESYSIQTIGNAKYMRYMGPLMVAKDCMQCHAKQGYTVGEVRGGISESVPMAPLWEIANRRARGLAVGHGLIWLVGIVGILLCTLHVQRRIRERDSAEQAQNCLIEKLRDVLDQVKTLQGILPICMHCHKIRHDEASWQGLEEYVEINSEAQFSHSLCPECLEKHYPEEESTRVSQ